MMLEHNFVVNIQQIQNTFLSKYIREDFVIDKSGVKTIEILHPTFKANREAIFGKINEDYIAKELDWYLSKSLNVYDMEEPPQIWKQVADKNGCINSNYGWCIFSDENYNQFNHVLEELRNNKDTRRAVMIYNRPSMWIDYNKDGMSDFMCTSNVHCFIRNNRLIYIVNQRSCDAIFGFRNDNAWHNYVYNLLHLRLIETYDELLKEDIVYQMGSLHIYERHFKFIDEYKRTIFEP